MFRYFFTAVSYKPGDEDIILDSSVALGSQPVDGLISTPQFYPCYPNPAASEIAFSFLLPNDADVILTIYDVEGRKVANVISSKTMSQGFHKEIFSASGLLPGTYMCKFESGNFSKSKMLIIQR
jgi:hypothetical protein